MRAAYVLPALLAMILVIGRILGAMPGVGALLLAGFLFMNISTREFKFWESARSLSVVKPTEPLRKLLHNADYPDTRVPIVVASGFLYVRLTFYDPGPVGQRLFYLATKTKNSDLSALTAWERACKRFKNTCLCKSEITSSLFQTTNVSCYISKIRTSATGYFSTLSSKVSGCKLSLSTHPANCS